MEKRIKKIIDLFLEDDVTEKDLQILQEWIRKPNHELLFREYLKHYYGNYKFDFNVAFEKFENKISSPNLLIAKRKKGLPVFFKYAAVLLGLVFTVAGSFLLNKEDNKVDPYQSQITLELEDGSLHILDESQVQNITINNGTVKVKQNQNQLSYNSKKGTNVTLIYNTLRIPNGQRFLLRLSDSSEVYLNAGSKIKYPVEFVEGQPRVVSLEGEGYFKIAKNKNSPFVVRANGINTEVFGTEFNVSSYTDDSFKGVVLVEGSVGVFEEGNRFKGELGVRLKPNEMAYKFKDTLKVSHVDVRSHIAWVEGNLHFNNENFSSIVKKIERHFNLSIVNNYEDLEQKRFTGKFDKESIEQILHTFQRTNKFNYIMLESKIIINP
ncbi:FecR domain-containing protein [Arenibacter sp. S6351L]|uniref:FecR family protein n=1 Tax=Arenibacter sp. S6351L TaxID=2926407 RepID=UPI001FF683CA|nr:FecR domain-containing protein [Arenibacter sp. S6351L]MCK0136072.1 DUF4974 domain-containing protein [Arenibacter sp. S6351L]